VTTLRVEAVLSGRLAPSSRFRVLQHVAPLGRLGIDVDARPPRVSKYATVGPRWQRRLGPLTGPVLTAAKLAARAPTVARSWARDLTWLEREMIPGSRTLEPCLHRPLLFDVDDAIWLLSAGNERAARWTARHAACVLAGNDYLAEWFTSAGATVERVWTAVDTDHFRPDPDPRPDRRSFVIGWTGSASALRYLAALAKPLGRFLAETPEARLAVVSDYEPSLPGIPEDRVDFVRWSPSVEASALAGVDVGLAPLPDSAWARGKCAFKMLQYMAAGIPMVASPVGMNAQVLAMAEVGLPAADDAAWRDALHDLRADDGRRRAMGGHGRRLVEREFAVPVIADRLAGIMRRHG
jgi:glycosyltransferase involved in cell wall biosynthesis